MFLRSSFVLPLLFGSLALVKLMIKYIFSYLTLMRNWNSSIYQTLMQFDFRTLIMDKCSTPNPIEYFFFLCQKKFQINI